MSKFSTFATLCDRFSFVCTFLLQMYLLLVYLTVFVKKGEKVCKNNNKKKKNVAT